MSEVCKRQETKLMMLPENSKSNTIHNLSTQLVKNIELRMLKGQGMFDGLSCSQTMCHLV